MRYPITLSAASILAVAFCILTGCFEGEDKPVRSDKIAALEDETEVLASESKTDEAKNGTGLSKDLRLLRKTILLPQKPPIRASSKDACEAAARIFDRIDFVGMSKKHVLWIIGDPRTISGFGRQVGDQVDDPLDYYFGNGYGGSLYRIEFKNNIAAQIRIIGIN